LAAVRADASEVLISPLPTRESTSGVRGMVEEEGVTMYKRGGVL
jgi:hypothetical protein